jgi:hypothetical protein
MATRRMELRPAGCIARVRRRRRSSDGRATFPTERRRAGFSRQPVHRRYDQPAGAAGGAGRSDYDGGRKRRAGSAAHLSANGRRRPRVERGFRHGDTRHLRCSGEPAGERGTAGPCAEDRAGRDHRHHRGRLPGGRGRRWSGGQCTTELSNQPESRYPRLYKRRRTTGSARSLRTGRLRRSRAAVPGRAACGRRAMAARP